MNLLALDASTSILSVAVSKKDKIFCLEQDANLRASDITMGSIEKQMKEADLNTSNLNGVLCTGGPGSFTGLRTGYSVCKGLALALSIPFVPIPTLDCIAFSTMQEIDFPCFLIPVIPAGKHSFYFSVYKNGKREIEDEEITNEKLTETLHNYLKYNEKIIIAGHGIQAFENIFENENNIKIINHNKGYAKELILISKNKKLFENDNSKYLYTGPEYIKKTDAEINWEKSRV